MSALFDQFDSYSTAYGETHLSDYGYVGADSFSSFDSDRYPPIHVSDPAYFSSGPIGNGPILPPPTEMEPEDGYALREWRRLNAIRLEEKENKEKELLNQIIVEADEYKVAFIRKRALASETHKAANREKEKVFVASQEKFHAEADKDYWKSIADLIPKEVPKIEKRKGKKEQDKKPSVLVVQGPKPGKPTDLARMRQILIKLKHNTPAHIKPSPPPNAGNATKAAPVVAVA